MTTNGGTDSGRWPCVLETEGFLGLQCGSGVRNQPTSDAFRDLGCRFLCHLVECLPSRRTQYRLPVGCRTSIMRCVGPPHIFRLMRTSAGSLGKNLTVQIW